MTFENSPSAIYVTILLRHDAFLQFLLGKKKMFSHITDFEFDLLQVEHDDIHIGENKVYFSIIF